MLCVRILRLALTAFAAVVLCVTRVSSEELWPADISHPISGFTSALLGVETGREIWTGADVAEHTWLLFSGFTFAPYGGIFDNGPRVRVMGGYGGYAYGREGSRYAVEKSYVDVLFGYQQRMSSLTAKIFIGLSAISHDIEPIDEITQVSGDDVGVKGMIELWLNMGERVWVSVDAAWAQPFNTTNIRSRVGYRIDRVSIGVEGALNLDEGVICRLADATPADCTLSPDVRAAKALVESGRGGLFARYDWGSGETSLSVGAIGNDHETSEPFSVYGTAQWLTQF